MVLMMGIAEDDMMSKITKEDKKLMEEIKKDKKAFQRLKNKAVWENMTVFAVLKEWGDPRGW